MSDAEASTIRTAAGAVTGLVDDRAVAAFRGIPYAAPPVGPLRFRPPVAREAWTGELDCTMPGAICPQGAPGEENRAGQHEDCLNLNVWTPGGEGLPIVVYFPGGGYMAENASAPITDGSALAARGAVVVAVNYRVHALGFLDLDEEHGPNAGLLDLVAALRWVHENGTAFGGDPQNVTIAGYSAGGNAVGSVLVAPDAAGLFHRAVMQDGGAMLNLLKPTTRQVGDDFLALVGIDRGDRAALEDLPVDALLRAVTQLAGAYGGVMPSDAQRKREGERRKGLTWTPTSNATLPRVPVDAVAHGDAAEVDLLISTCRDSMTLLTDHMTGIGRDDIAAYLGNQLESRSMSDVLAAYELDVPGAPLHDVLGAILTDLLLAQQGVRLAEAQLAHHDRVWLAEYCSAHPKTGKAVHGVDSGAWFGNVARGTSSDAPAAVLADAMADAFVAFARSGEPKSAALGDWPPYTTAERATMLLDVPSRVASDPHASRRELWSGSPLP